MGKVSVSINGRTIQALAGDTLVDAAMGGRLLIPHDCASGQCNTCRVTVVSGDLDDRGTRQGETVLACQARVRGPAVISFDEPPAVSRRVGVVTSVTPVSSDVVEIIVSLNSPFPYLPGQYVNLTFPGCPPRDYSPSPRLDGTISDTELAFQIRRYPGGAVSSAIGRTVVPGAAVRVAGPHGSAFLRNPREKIVLVAGGTGWAPVWSIARAAIERGYAERMTVIAGSVNMDGLYMRKSFDWLAGRGFDRFIAAVDVGATGAVRLGRPTEFLPSLGARDDVYVAGAPGLVNAVVNIAGEAAARCFTDPFTPGAQMRSMTDRVMDVLRGRAPAHEDVLSPIPGGAQPSQMPPDRAAQPQRTPGGLAAVARALLGRRTGGV